MVRAFVVTLALVATARAEPMLWLIADTRIPLPSSASPFVPREFRVFSEVRLANVADGVQELQLRVGPWWVVHDHLLLALHATATIKDDLLRAVASESRLEFEANTPGRLGPVWFNDRNRLEVRFIERDVRFRYRNQLRLDLKGTAAYPFLSEEVLVDLSGEGFNQNRALAGLAWELRGDTRLDLGFMVRSRKTSSGWANDGVLLVQLAFAPRP